MLTFAGERRRLLHSRNLSRALVLLSAAAMFARMQPQSSSAFPEVRIRSGPYHPPSDFAVESNLVELAETVRDHAGAPVGGLTKADFLLFDNSTPRDITFFSEEGAAQPPSPGATGAATASASASGPVPEPSAKPRYIALFFDDTHAAMAGFERSRRAAQKLIGDGLQPGDRMGIYTSSGAVALDFTGDAKTLLATLAGMHRHPERGATGFGRCPTLTAYQAYMITSHLDPMAKEVAAVEIMSCFQVGREVAEDMAEDDAAAVWSQLRSQSSNVLDTLVMIVRHLAAEPGARVLLMVSPGFVTGDMESQTSAVTDECLRGHIMVNALDDEGLLSGGGDAPEALGARGGMRANWANRTLGLRAGIVTSFMSEAASSTGGTFFHNDNDLSAGLRTLAAPPPVYYLLGFSPNNRDGKHHKLRVTVTKPGNYQTSGRPGYIATRPSDRSETAQRRIDRVVSSNEILNRVPATVKVSSVPGRNGKYRIAIRISLDAKRLPFRASQGVSLQELTFVTVLEDAAGNYIEGREAVMDMALSGAKRASLEAKGINADTSFVAPKGSYVIREVIREAVHNQLWANNSQVEIR